MKQQINNTALYLRLSRDDENYGDSVSIETQRTILRQFVKDNGFHVVDEYVDDGWTGTNFDRPAFKRMIEDVESGRINCIITKDLSRFGREHVMMGYYLEFYFVEKNVRYIAVSDGEDTEKGLSDFVPFKNLFNEWYAKDTSRKIKASMNAKFKAGERTCAYAPVGYKKHPEIKNKLAVDEETKWIIEKIYGYALLGYGAGKITKKLIEEKMNILLFGSCT
jgi:DNA invertase Pin-like site-specific DNA recombinase